MANKRGRPRKAPKVEINKEVAENIAKERELQDFVSEGMEKHVEVKPEIDISDVDYQKSEPDIYDLNTPTSVSGPSYNPFEENVNEKEYRTPHIAPAESIPGIVEPAFQRPTYDDIIASTEETVPELQKEKTGVEAFAQDPDGENTK